MERNTFQKFCPKKELYLDRYSMLDAQRDRFTVPLSYEAKLSKYHLNREQLAQCAKFEEEEIGKLSGEEKKALQRKVSVIRTFAKRPDRIAIIANNLSGHFTNVVEPAELKAMVVTIDREACILYKRAMDKLLPSDYSEVVMTFDAGKKIIREYFEELQQKYNSRNIKQIHNRIIEGFKTKDAPKILIVTDMLITGFDAPNLWTMYLDKPLKEHRTLQTIARTNRPFHNKKFGLIVDYIGILKELERAYEQFEAGEAKNLKVVIRGLEKEKETFKNLIQKGLKLFVRVKREDTHESLATAMDRLVDPEKAKEFESLTWQLMQSYEMLSGEPFLRDYLSDYKWLVQVFIAYNKKFKKAGVDELKIDMLSKKTVRLIRETIDVKGIEDRYKTIMIDDSYIENLRRTPSKTVGAAIDVGSNITQEARSHSDSPFFASISQQVEDTYERLRRRKIETEKAIEEFLKAARKITTWKTEEKEIGKDRYPIYEAIKSTIPELPKGKAISFTESLLKMLEKKGLIFKDWQLQREVKRRAKAEIQIQVIAKFKEHKDKVDELASRIFEALEGLK